ncbi:hypothetical protein L4D20_03705 [Vibrio kyushuensis]|uniref:hypothetical protein n=1 Tax=Vibrio kyushuensis TaxID=2910249 RepID=UPI003D1101C4
MIEKANKHNDDMLIQIMLFILGALIVWFNILGYDILFPNDDFSINPFSALLFFTEAAVLVWTSQVIKNWYTTSRLLKMMIFILVPAFWFLCYSGINSYLNSLATSEISTVESEIVINDNRNELINSLEVRRGNISGELSNLRSSNQRIDISLSESNQKISELSTKSSDRRLTQLDCNAVEDCRVSVENYQQQIDTLSHNMEVHQKDKEGNSERIRRLESELIDIDSRVSGMELEIVESRNSYAGTETSFNQKKEVYESIVLQVSSWFGLTPSNPFGVFVSFISMIIYPVYFILNLLVSLNTEEHKEIRRAKKDKKTKQKDYRLAFYNRMIKYFRVWAHRRTKTVEVDKIVEVPVEVEKEVERIVEVPVEVEVDKIIEVEKIVNVEVEVVKEVEKIVEIEKEVEKIVEKIVEVPVEIEVPVYIDKIHKVSEPMIIKEPQIIIHERIVPIPEDITANELEELLNAKPGSDETSRVEQTEMETSSAA